MKRFIIYLKVYWVTIAISCAGVGVAIFMFFFLRYCLTNFFLLEGFTRRQLSGQMAMLLPMFILVQLMSLPFIFFMNYYFMRGGGMGKLEKAGKAKAQVKWDEVIGMETAKQEAWELVKLLKDRSLLKAIGGKIIKGTMMLGPPGCGKTYLAKAIATECGIPMISVSGSEFVGILVGQGAARMKSLFKEARGLAKIEGGCIVFIDEIDSFARSRSAETSASGISHNATINQFLTEMDGLRQQENNVVVIAATNAAEGELDEALMRAGRFDRKINVTKPNLKERKMLFDFYLDRVDADEKIDTEMLARKALWFSSADIDSMVREAGLIALRDKRDKIVMKDLSEAYERVTFGLKANITLTKKEKEWTAYHEAGHAVIAFLTHPTNDVIKATIIPTKGALGMVWQRPVEELYSSNKDVLLANIKVSVASYAAEKIVFGMTSSGVGGGSSSDFAVAMQYAHRMVWQLGMGKSGLIGDFYILANGHNGNLLSERTRETLDADVQDILQSCIRQVEDILKDKRDLLNTFAQELLKREELDYDQISLIFEQFGLTAASKITNS